MSTTDQPQPLLRPTSRRLLLVDQSESLPKDIYRRVKFAETRDAKRRPWIFHCRQPNCWFVVGAESEAHAKAIKWKHGKHNPCPRIGELHVNRTRVR